MRWSIILAVAVASGLISSVATMVIAGPSPPVTGTGTDITRVKTIASSVPVSTSSTTVGDVPGASRNIMVSGGAALLVARFTGESICGSASVSTGCFVRIVVDDGSTVTEMNPAGTSSGDTLFDSDSICSASAGTCSSTDGFEQHAIDRSLTVGSGTYTVKVQFWTGCTCLTFTLDDWHLTVERIV